MSLTTHPRAHILDTDGTDRKGKPRYRAQVSDLMVGDTLAEFGKVLEWSEVAPEGGDRMFRIRTEYPQNYPVRTDVMVMPAYVHYGVTALAEVKRIRLQGVGWVPAVEAHELRAGDTVMWNYGSTSEVVGIADVSPAFLRLTLREADGTVNERRMKKAGRLVARVTAAPPVAQEQPQEAPTAPQSAQGAAEVPEDVEGWQTLAEPLPGLAAQGAYKIPGHVVALHTEPSDWGNGGVYRSLRVRVSRDTVRIGVASHVEYRAGEVLTLGRECFDAYGAGESVMDALFTAAEARFTPAA